MGMAIRMDVEHAFVIATPVSHDCVEIDPGKRMLELVLQNFVHAIYGEQTCVVQSGAACF
jgi:hypothetical protein